MNLSSYRIAFRLFAAIAASTLARPLLSTTVEAVRAVQAEATTNAAATQGAAPERVASPDTVERFQAAMGMTAPAPVEGAQQIDGIPLANEIAATWRSAQVDRQGLLHRIRALTEMSESNGYSLAQLTELQYEVATLSFQQEVVAKVAEKSSAAVQTLIKNQ